MLRFRASRRLWKFRQKSDIMRANRKFKQQFQSMMHLFWSSCELYSGFAACVARRPVCLRQVHGERFGRILQIPKTAVGITDGQQRDNLVPLIE